MHVLLAAVVIVGLLVFFGVLNASGFFDALPLLLLLGAVSFASYMVVRANLDPAWAGTAAAAAPAAVLAWAAWRPTLSKAKLWVMMRARVSTDCARWLGLFAFALTLPANGFRLDVWIERGWPWLMIAAAAWAAGSVVNHAVNRSMRSDQARAQPSGAGE